MPPPVKKATLHKIFMLDAEGNYRGVVPLDENCLVEYSEFLAALPEQGLEDGQSIFLTEWKATAIYGEQMGLVAISKGSLGPEEINWARAALVAAEAVLLGKAMPVPAYDDTQATEDREALESMTRALEERDKELRQREEAFKRMEKQTRAAVDEYRREMEAQVADLKAQLEAERAQNRREPAGLGMERERVFRGPRQPSTPSTPSRSSPWGARDFEVEEEKEKIAQERKAMQMKALEFLEREETLRDRETRVEEEHRRVLAAREEAEQMRTKIEATKSAAPAFDAEAAKREIDQRVKILQQKAMDLIAREEQLKKRAEEIQALLNSSM